MTIWVTVAILLSMSNQIDKRCSGLGVGCREEASKCVMQLVESHGVPTEKDEELKGYYVEQCVEQWEEIGEDRPVL